MYAVHGYLCNTKTFPLTCKDCGDRIFFFQCDCGSRALFDDLGPPWPQHRCGDDLPEPTHNPSDADIYRAMQGVTESVRPKGYDLLPGMKRFSGRLDASIVDRVGRSKSKTRDIMRIEPMGRADEHIGIVAQVGAVSITDRRGVAPDSPIARQAAKILGGLTVTQLTIHVDEIAVDPDAEDILSYTIWLNPQGLPRSLAEGAIVSVAIRPIDIFGIGYKWIADKLDVIA